MSKKLVQINVVCNGSTGRIMNQIQHKATSQGWEAYNFYGRGKPSNDNCYKICNKLEILWSVFLTRFFDKHGYGCKRATKKMIKKIEKIDPDVIQLHNIHGYYLNLDILFKYLRKCNKKIFWTLHDCWAFTGHCTHFTYPKCEKWKKGCQKCIRIKDYPTSFKIDNSEKNYKHKKELFTGIKDLNIITPSEWLKKLVQESFLKEYPVTVINNGIDLEMFKPTKTINIYRKYKIPKNKKIILGVAAIWDEKKGLEDFIELSNELKEDYVIVLVGLDDKQIKKLPNNIIGIKRTENIDDLVNLYTAASVLFNPSKEETFSMVTIEAMACGTPVIAYDNSAVKELINNGNGICLLIENKKRNIEILINYTKQQKKEEKNSIKHNGLVYLKKYDKEIVYENYMNKYNECINKNKIL